MTPRPRTRTPAARTAAVALAVAVAGVAALATLVAAAATAPARGQGMTGAGARAGAQAGPGASAQSAPVARPRASAQAGARASGCEGCHGELELLRQQARSLTRAQQLLVPEHVLAASAHGDMNCAGCHTGFNRYPHEGTLITATCASCHAPADSLWQHSTHAGADDPVTCVQCHGTHDVRTAEQMREPEGAAAANAPCVSCHHANDIEAHRPHAGSVLCAACHAPHDTRPVDDPASWLAPAQQAATCAACHQEEAAQWRTDIHGDAALRGAHLAGREPVAATVTCTSCHTGHSMVAPGDPAFMVASVQGCTGCHEEAARTFYNSYHGRATALGSRVSATCADCHGSHAILPDSFPASRVAQGNLVETCAACHENARPAFVLYDPHPDPFNRARNPWIFYSFFLMNGLLVFVLLVFGSHTVLWWLRLWLDRRRGIVHGIGVHHGPGPEPQDGGDR